MRRRLNILQILKGKQPETPTNTEADENEFKSKNNLVEEIEEEDECELVLNKASLNKRAMTREDMEKINNVISLSQSVKESVSPTFSTTPNITEEPTRHPSENVSGNITVKFLYLFFA